MDTPVYRLEKLNFDGPLDLLLKLLDRNKIDIYDIPIAEITRQYMEQVEAMEEDDMEIVSSFLVMAATLLDIKARMLLSSDDDESGQEQEDPRAALVERLLEYKHCRYVASGLRECGRNASMQYYRYAPLPGELAGYVPETDLDCLLEGVTAERLKSIYLSITRRMRHAVNNAAESFSTIRKDRVSVVKCLERLKGFAREHSSFTFRQMFADKAKREEIVVSFLAVLELMRLGRITVRQSGREADIEVSVNKEGLEGVDLEGILDQ